MTITQKKLIREIPLIVKSESLVLLCSLRSLAYSGWGSESRVYRLIEFVINESINAPYGVRLRFDSETHTLTKIKCKACNDYGYKFKKVAERRFKVDCKKCDKNDC